MSINILRLDAFWIDRPVRLFKFFFSFQITRCYSRNTRPFYFSHFCILPFCANLSVFFLQLFFRPFMSWNQINLEFSSLPIYSNLPFVFGTKLIINYQRHLSFLLVFCWLFSSENNLKITERFSISSWLQSKVMPSFIINCNHLF